jgi:hypothetical protein
MEHCRRTGDQSAATVDAYNASVASPQARFWPAARRLEQLTVMTEGLPEVVALTHGVRRAPQTDPLDE